MENEVETLPLRAEDDEDLQAYIEAWKELKATKEASQEYDWTILDVWK
jgi:hypothetical protein